MGDRTLLSPYAVLPAVQTLLRRPELLAQRGAYAHATLVTVTRTILQEARDALDSLSDSPTQPIDTETLVAQILERLSMDSEPAFRGLINASGILFHPSAGLTPTAPEARAAVVGTLSPVAQTLEAAVCRLLCHLTGAEAALTLSSPQAAFWLVADTLGRDKEIVVSRGHLGVGSDNWSTLEVLQRCAAHVVEVGATNKTHLADFDTAVNENTSLICTIRPVNYALKGFAEEVPLSDLARIGKEKEIPVCADIGCALLMPTSFPDWSAPPSAYETLQEGADLVVLHGDGLAGGPPSGLILGNSVLIEAVRRNPLYPMIKPTLSTLAAWEAQLRIYRQRGASAHPANAWLSASLAGVRRVAEQFAQTMQKSLATRGKLAVIDSPAFLTRNRLPDEAIPSVAVAYRPVSGRSDELADALYRGTPALLTRVESDQLLLHLRGFSEEEVSVVSNLLRSSC